MTKVLGVSLKSQLYLRPQPLSEYSNIWAFLPDVSQHYWAFVCIYVLNIWTFVDLAPIKLFHFGKREVLEHVNLMEDQWDNLMLFDAAMYMEDQTSHLKDEEHWDPTQVYGVRGKLPKSVPKALEHV